MNKIINLKNDNIKNIIIDLKNILKNLNENVNQYENNNFNLDRDILNINNINDKMIIGNRLSIINEHFNVINIEIMDLLTEIKNKKLIDKNIDKNSIINYNKSNEIIKPFLPYMLLYSLIYEKNI